MAKNILNINIENIENLIDNEINEKFILNDYEIEFKIYNDFEYNEYNFNIKFELNAIKFDLSNDYNYNNNLLLTHLKFEYENEYNNNNKINNIIYKNIFDNLKNNNINKLNEIINEIDNIILKIINEI